MTLNSEKSVLLIVDLQDRLLPAIKDSEPICLQTIKLIGIARELQIPIIATEQYPKGLGRTVPAIHKLLKPEEVLEKTHFSAVQSGALLNYPHNKKEQWIVCGTETHVCVLQTVLDLLKIGHHVAVVEEATGSRTQANKNLAIERMRQHGAEIVSTEMVAFEWLNKADTPRFRTILDKFIR